MPAMGYDFVPGAVAGALALDAAGARASRVDVGYFMLGGRPSSMSAGTKASLAGVALSEAFAYRGGEVRAVRSAERYRTFPVKGKERPGISVGGAEHFTLPAVVSAAAGGQRLPRLVRAAGARDPAHVAASRPPPRACRRSSAR